MLSSTRPGRWRSPTRWRSPARRTGWSCSATRSSSPTSARGLTRAARARRCSSTCSATARPSAGRGRVPRAHLAHAPGRLPLRVEHDVRGPAQAVDGHWSARLSLPGLSGAGVRLIEVGTRKPPERARGGRADRRGGRELLDGGRYTDADGAERELALEDILVVAPYNAQVRYLRTGCLRGARIGTVDKFQGQEAPVVFFSMTASAGEDVPRGMDFLFRSQPAQRRGVAGTGARGRGLLAAAAVGALQHGRADAARQRAVLVRRRGGAPAAGAGWLGRRGWERTGLLPPPRCRVTVDVCRESNLAGQVPATRTFRTVDFARGAY